MNDTAAGAAAGDLVRTLAGGRAAGDSTIAIVGADPVSPSPHRIAEASAAVIAAFGREVAAADEDRGAPAQRITVTVPDALDQLRAPFLAEVNGVGPEVLSDDPGLLGLNAFYPARDGWVFLVSTYPHLRAAVCDVLGCPPTAEAITDATRMWSAVELEEAVVAAGGVAAAARTGGDWAGHPVGRYLAARPVVEIDRIGDAPACPWPPAGPGHPDEGRWAPLAGIRVLDNTHVIAGPLAARLAGAFGAEVVHTSRPDRPDPIGMLAITGGGKRNAYADLRTPAGCRGFDALAAAADVMLCSYRNLARYGFGPRDLAARHPGIVVAELHCWGPDGPWGARGGFDQLASAATGFALDEGAARGLEPGRPALPPTHLLNDYLAAYLAGAGLVAALRRRAVEGGSWRVRVNLARVCMWVRSHDLFPPGGVAGIALPEPTIARYTVTGPLGTLTEPVIPITFSGHPTPTPGVPTLLGTAPLTFTGQAAARGSQRRA
ncbi:CoA transferase [Amycolatopsis sp. PS_44_ISF1]|uniref:CoA transferase n=1 Tax=Amycolatopsis sp. PS_44_ISF1 TaxID=2974917 RepID=UPI0028DF6AE9|nr:CoA transferase [Amycolatopsis sp. PS_44_ISF1]MDT8913656.1 CoA transferase [Amycolatopsis sp. PS_44_ISF1]